MRTLKSWRRRAEGVRQPVGTTDQLPDDRASEDRAADTGADDDQNPFGREHAWWAERERLQRVFVAPSVDDEDDKSPLSEFWSPESLFTWGRRPGDEDDYFQEQQPFDPHEVLGLPLYAPWDQVVAAHRRLAKEHHPDRLVDATPDDRAASEERMRLVNQAYNELRRLRAASPNAG